MNPLYIQRNHQVERAIQAAINGDLSVFQYLNQVLQKPFDEQPEFPQYAEPPQPEEHGSADFLWNLTKDLVFEQDGIIVGKDSNLINPCFLG